MGKTGTSAVSYGPPVDTHRHLTKNPIVECLLFQSPLGPKTLSPYGNRKFNPPFGDTSGSFSVRISPKGKATQRLVGGAN